MSPLLCRNIICVKNGGVEILLAELHSAFVGTTRKELERYAGRELLSSYMEGKYGVPVSPNDIVFGAQGKPYFSEEYLCRIGQKVYFNISHSGDYIACAVAPYEIGCDIQRYRKVPKGVSCYLTCIPTLQITEHELERLPVPEQTEVWARYESLAKCLGIGIPISLEVYEKTHQECKFLWQICDAPRGYVLAVCEQQHKRKGTPCGTRKLLTN